MEYKRTTWKSREVEHQNRFTMKDNGDGTVTLTPSPGKILETGTPASADNFNNMESGIGIAIELAEKSNFKLESIDIYIDIDRGSDITGTGSSSKPFKTFNGAKSLLESRAMWNEIDIVLRESNNIHGDIEWKNINSFRFAIKGQYPTLSRVKNIILSNGIPGTLIQLQHMEAGNMLLNNLKTAEIYMANIKMNNVLETTGRFEVSRASRLDISNLDVVNSSPYSSAVSFSEIGSGTVSKMIVNSNSKNVSNIYVINSLLRFREVIFNQKVNVTGDLAAINIDAGQLAINNYSGDLKGASIINSNGAVVLLGNNNTTNGKIEIKTNGGQVFKSS